MSARLTLIRNPFIPDKNRITGYYPYKTIGEARAWLDGQEVNITVDGWAVTDSYEPKDGEIVVITPVVGFGGNGKSVLGIVAMVAVAAVSMGVGSFVAGNGFWAMSFANATFGAFAAAYATMFVGGLLVSRIMTTSVDNGNYDVETNATYSWGDPQTMEGQNNPIAITYGKVQSSGQTIGKYVSYNEDGDEILNWLVACGEGELAITNIKLNDTSIDNFTDVTAEIRTGTNNQSVISNFNDTITPFTVGTLVEGTTPVTRTDITGTANQGLIFKIGCESGLYYSNDSGGLDTAWVKVKLEYKLHSATDWTTWKTVTISGNQSSALRKEYRIDNLTAGQYDARVTVTERSHSETSSRACVRVTWTYLDTIVYDDFTYPGIALIGIKGLATNQINGSPTLKFIKERQYVWVWNPDASAYEQKTANNPAWACYDMLHQCQRVLNINTNEYEYYPRGVDKSHILYDQFEEWAEWCEEEEKEVNLEVVETGEMLETINNNIACIGHGLVIRFGTKYGCKWAHEQTPIQMFGMGNILKGSFEENFMSLDDRANCIEITFTDAERDYERRTITVFGDTYNTDATEKSSQITYNGITSYQQAYEEGKYQMACNKYLLRTVSFDASVDAIACTVGDVIIVSHDIIQAAFSGRISDVNDTAVTLPVVDTVDTTKSYKLMFRSSEYDTLEEVTCTLAYVSGELIATMTQTPTHAPVVNDIFDLALVSTGRRMYTVQNISRASDFTRHIEALEYNAGIFDDPGTAPVISYTAATVLPTNVTGLSAAQVAYVKKDGTYSSQLNLSWNAATSGGRYNVYISTDGKDWTALKNGVSQLSLKADVQPWTTYYVKVVTILGAYQSTGAVLYPVSPGTDVLPPSVTELNAEILGDGTRRYYWTFTYPDPDDIAGFRMKYYQGTGGNWDTAVEVQEGLITTQPFEATTIRQGTHTVMIKAVDNAGQESSTAATCLINCGEPLADNIVDTKDFSENNWECLNFGYFWNTDTTADFWSDDTSNGFWQNHEHDATARGIYIGSDGKLYTQATDAYWLSPNSEQWTSASAAAWTSALADVYVEFEHTAAASGYWWLQYEITGAFTIYYWLNTDGVKKQYSTRVKVAAGDVIHISLEATNSNIVVSSFTSVVDVPDRTEHFTNLSVSTSGTTLDIQTPNYKTVAVHIDSIPLDEGIPLYPQIVTREPCVIKLIAADGTAHSATANITWQGYEKEVTTDGE